MLTLLQNDMIYSSLVFLTLAARPQKTATPPTCMRMWFAGGGEDNPTV